MPCGRWWSDLAENTILPHTPRRTGPNGAVKNAVGAALCGRPSSVTGRFPVYPVGEGLAPPAGFRNFFGQRWGGGAPGRRALRASWSTEGGPGDPPVPRCGTFSLSSRRGGAYPSRRVSEFFRSTLGWRRAGSSRPTDVMVHEGWAALCGCPSPVVGRFPVHPVGEGLTPPAGFRNFFG